MLEVEQKYRIDDRNAVLEHLRTSGARPGKLERHQDTYFRHPCRDFVKTNEALRIRRIDSIASVTYKGPKMHVEKAAKVRKEIEWCLSPGDSEGEQLHDLLTSLGFTPVATVSKQRQSFHWPDHHPELSPVTFTLDDVDEVGLFAEIEWIVDEKRQAESSSEGVDLAIGQLQRIANQFELTELVRESYLELLLLRRGR